MAKATKEVIALTAESVNHFMGRKANKALFAQALAKASGVEFGDPYLSKVSAGYTRRYRSTEMVYTQTSAPHQTQIVSEVKVNVYTSGVSGDVNPGTLQVSVRIDNLDFGTQALGSVLIHLDGFDDLRNPMVLLGESEELIAKFDEAKALIADQRGWVNGQIVALAFKTRDAMFKQAEEILTATIVAEESADKRKIAALLSGVDYRFDYSDVARQAKELESNLRAIDCAEHYRQSRDQRAAQVVVAEAAE